MQFFWTAEASFLKHVEIKLEYKSDWIKEAKFTSSTKLG